MGLLGVSWDILQFVNVAQGLTRGKVEPTGKLDPDRPLVLTIQGYASPREVFLKIEKEVKKKYPHAQVMSCKLGYGGKLNVLSIHHSVNQIYQKIVNNHLQQTPKVIIGHSMEIQW